MWGNFQIHCRERVSGNFIGLFEFDYHLHIDDVMNLYEFVSLPISKVLLLFTRLSCLHLFLICIELIYIMEIPHKFNGKQSILLMANKMKSFRFYLIDFS